MGAYEEGDISSLEECKLIPRGDGPFQVVERINNNAYKLDLPGEYQVSATFNVTDLTPYDVGEDLRTNLIQEGENDGGPEPSQSTNATCAVQLPTGPLTKVKVKRVRDWVNAKSREIRDGWIDVKRIAVEEKLMNLLQGYSSKEI